MIKRGWKEYLQAALFFMVLIVEAVVSCLHPCEEFHYCFLAFMLVRTQSIFDATRESSGPIPVRESSSYLSKHTASKLIPFWHRTPVGENPCIPCHFRVPLSHPGGNPIGRGHNFLEYGLRVPEVVHQFINPSALVVRRDSTTMRLRCQSVLGPWPVLPKIVSRNIPLVSDLGGVSTVFFVCIWPLQLRS